jgi:hypothetical protein
VVTEDVTAGNSYMQRISAIYWSLYPKNSITQATRVTRQPMQFHTLLEALCVGITVLRYSVQQSRVTDPAAEPKFGPSHSVTATSAGPRNSHRSEKLEENVNFWPCRAQALRFRPA